MTVTVFSFMCFGPILKLEQYNYPSFSVLPLPNLLCILTHFIAFDSAGQAESLDQPATILNQFFNISTRSYLKNKWEWQIVKLCAQKKRLMLCDPSLYKNSQSLHANDARTYL